MKCLVAEDDPEKRSVIIDIVKVFENVSKVNVQIIESSNYIDTVDLIDEVKFDKIILDMSLPTDDEAMLARDYNLLAGEDILFELNCIENPPPILVITRYPKFNDGDGEFTLIDIEERVKKNLKKLDVKFVYYDLSSLEWKEELSLFLRSEKEI